MFRGLCIVAAVWLIAARCGAQNRETIYRFKTADYKIEMSVRPFPPYLGQRLSFHNSANPGMQVCVSGNGESGSCVEKFVGSLATVTYRFKPRRRDVRPPATFREVVNVLAQSPELAGRDSYVREQPLLQGVGTDIQAFGYDESGVAQPECEALRSQWRGLWRIYRQELFLNGDSEPFAVVEWKHTTNRIEVVRTVGQPFPEHPLTHDSLGFPPRSGFSQFCGNRTCDN